VKNSAILLVQCPDRKGLDATIAEFIYRYDGNILHFEQHQAGEERYYLARVEWDLAGFRLSLADFDAAFGPVAHKFGMNWCIALSDYRPRVAIFVSKYDHCLVDLRISADDQQSSGCQTSCRFSRSAVSSHSYDQRKQSTGGSGATGIAA
jgi:formyltetrahydrofolate hydrolase